MSKAILILDEMPKNCEECKYIAASMTGYVCWQTGKDIELTDRADTCPLKPLPEELLEGRGEIYDDGVRDGWNTCLRWIKKGDQK